MLTQWPANCSLKEIQWQPPQARLRCGCHQANAEARWQQHSVSICVCLCGADALMRPVPGFTYNYGLFLVVKDALRNILITAEARHLTTDRWRLFAHGVPYKRRMCNSTTITFIHLANNFTLRGNWNWDEIKSGHSFTHSYQSYQVCLLMSSW